MKKNYQLPIINYQSIFNISILKPKSKKSLSIDHCSLRISQRGFTLIEVLVTIVIIGIIGYLLSDILVKSLNNGRKSQVIGNVKQNAQVALTTMSTTIRDADAVTCTNIQPNVLVPGTAVGLLNKDGNFTRFSYQAPGVGTNGYLVEDFPNKTVYPPLANVAESVNLCNFGTYPLVNQIFLTDPSTVSGVSVISALFTDTQNAGSKDSVNISFDFNSNTISTGVQNTLGSPTHYETTIQLR